MVEVSVTFEVEVKVPVRAQVVRKVLVPDDASASLEVVQSAIRAHLRGKDHRIAEIEDPGVGVEILAIADSEEFQDEYLQGIHEHLPYAVDDLIFTGKAKLCKDSMQIDVVSSDK